jgi:hypothetical protein
MMKLVVVKQLVMVVVVVVVMMVVTHPELCHQHVYLLGVQKHVPCLLQPSTYTTIQVFFIIIKI